MPRVRKQVVALLKSLRRSELVRLMAPRLRALRRERAALGKRLGQVEDQIAAIEGAIRATGRRFRRVRKAVKVPRPGRRARKGTMTDRIKSVLTRATAPMRVSEVCKALIRSGVEEKKGLTNYVNRLLSSNPEFAKAGWGLYRLAGEKSTTAPKKTAAKGEG